MGGKDAKEMNFAKNLQQARKNLGISQAELAKRLGKVQGAVAMWESGIREPKLSELEKIAKVLLTTPTKLIE